MSERPNPHRFAPWLKAAVLLLAVSSAAASHAAPITFQYGGVITSADPSTDVALGTRFSGTFTYDPNAKAFVLSDLAGMNQYSFGRTLANDQSASDGTGLTLQVGGKTVLANQGGVTVGVTNAEYGGVNGPGSISLLSRIGVSNGELGHNSIEASLELQNTTRLLLASLAPPTSINLADFPSATLLVMGNAATPQESTLYTGTIDTLTMVPEPASTMLLCLSAAVCLARSRRRRAK